VKYQRKQGYDSTFGTAVKNAKIQRPAGQMTHVLHHTFASHFMMNGGNILVLQRILGHASIVDTMKYSHFAPDHLEDAVRLNPELIITPSYAFILKMIVIPNTNPVHVNIFFIKILHILHINTRSLTNCIVETKTMTKITFLLELHLITV